MKKESNITILIIIAVIIFVVAIQNKPVPETPEKIVQCIGARSTLYVQLGCHACAIQEEMFGDNYKYLKIIDCYSEREKCVGIEATPTWIIKDIKYRGVQSIETLQQLTDCFVEY